MKRCAWVGEDPDMIEYHDKEWGTPLYDDRKQFEYMSLEVMQCGLSWMTVLKKRNTMRAALDNFNPEMIANYSDNKVTELLTKDGIIKSERKIKALVKNAKAFLKVQEEFGSFSNYIWSFTAGKSVEYPGHAEGAIVIASNALSEEISTDLKRRGFIFLGPVTMYSHLQACGIINDHRDYCFRYKELKQ